LQSFTFVISGTEVSSYIFLLKPLVLMLCEAFRRQRIANDSELKEYIKDQSLSDPLETARIGDLAAKPDPKCRFM